jgi:RimJ/RimL family protein N-acetyltransferase
MSDSVSLRPVRLADVDALLPLMADWEVIQWLSSPPWPYARADMEEFFHKRARLPVGGPELFRVVTVDHAAAGIVSILRRQDAPELGYWLGRPYWGRGVMQRAARTITQEYFDSPTATTVSSGAREQNVASLRIQAWLGFVETSRQLQFFRPHGAECAVIRTTLTRDRFEALHGRFEALQGRPGQLAVE